MSPLAAAGHRKSKLLLDQRTDKLGCSLARSLLHWLPLHDRRRLGAHSGQPGRGGREAGAPMRNVVAVLLLASLLIGGAQTAASAPDDQADTPSQVRMDVRAGFDGAGRVGGWVPLDVSLVNEGAELKANVEVVVDQPGGRSTYSYVPTTFSLPVVLPRLSNRQFTMEVNLPNATNNRLTARLVS